MVDIVHKEKPMNMSKRAENFIKAMEKVKPALSKPLSIGADERHVVFGNRRLLYKFLVISKFLQENNIPIDDRTLALILIANEIDKLADRVYLGR